MASIRFSAVNKRYGTTPSVSDLDLEIADHEFVVLLGPSGCGKSTTLNMIAGLEEITSGTLHFDDQLMNHVPVHRRDVAMVFQSYALYPHKTVFENIAFGLRMRRVPAADLARRVHDAAERLELTPLLQRRPGQLSGGQRQRVALGRAMVREPAVFLMDEPLSNLDASLRVSMRAQIRHLHASMRSTFVYVTHDQAEALTLADRIVVMRDGRVQQVGTPADIYDRPANLFVASFLGSPAINLLEGHIVPENGAPHFRRGTLAIPLPTTARPGPATLGIRAEDLRPASPGPAHLHGTVAAALSIGSDQLLELAIEGATLFVRVPKDTPYTEGQTAAFTIDPARLHLFEPSGRNLFA